jgi:ATP-dependent Clp protease ATP-binding subunit ClpA
MGVTKQAAQKRFVPKASDWGDLLSGAFPPDPVKFSRFTDRAQRTVIAARQEAIKRRHDRVLPEHLTLGLLHEQEGLAARAIAALGVSPEAARAAIGAVLPAALPDGVTPGHVPFDSRTMKVLELTLREALALGHNYIGTEHILLGLLEEESPGGGTLAGLGITKDRTLAWLVPVLEQMAAAKGH